MKENMKKFLEAVEANEELNAKVEELEQQNAEETVKQMIALAAEYGYALTEEDFVLEEGEMSEEDLEAVAGGMAIIYNQPLKATTLEYRHRYSGGPTAQTLEYKRYKKKPEKSSDSGIYLV